MDDDFKTLKNLKSACLRKILAQKELTARLHAILEQKVEDYRNGSHSLDKLEEGELLCQQLKQMANGDFFSMGNLGKLAKKREAMANTLVKNGVTILDMQQVFDKKDIPEFLRIAIDVRNKIVMDNENLVYGVIKKALGKDALRNEDLTSAGMEGLLKAADRYNLDLKLQFGTYAAQWIKKLVFEEIRHLTETPDNYATVATYLKNYLGNETPDTETLMALTGLPETTVKRAIEHYAKKVVSLDFSMEEDGAPLSSCVPDDRETPEDIVARKELFTKIADVIERLPVKASHKVVLHAHLIEGKTLADAGKKANMSTTNVKKIMDKHRGRIINRLGWSPSR